MIPEILPQAIFTSYANGRPNSAIELLRGGFKIDAGETRIELNGHIYLDWLIHPTINLKLSGPGDFTRSKEDNFRKFTVNTVHCDEALTILGNNINHNYGDDVTEIDATVDGVIIKGTNNFKALVFHIANFSLHGKGIIRLSIDGTNACWTGRRFLETDDWLITLDSVRDHQNVVKSLGRLGGYCITHIGSLQRRDGDNFDYNGAAEVIEAFHYLLSFIQGSWTEPFFEVGMDESSELNWQRWKAPNTDPWLGPSVWLDTKDEELNLSPLLKSFQTTLCDPQSGDVLKRAINWYIKANRSEVGLEGSIVLAQTALEMLAWNLFTETRPISLDGFKKMPEVDRLRLLFADAGMSTEVPIEMGELLKAARAFNWDAPKAIVEIRNMIVHPDRKNRDKLARLTKSTINETYSLTLWYLEMVILYRFGFKNTYFSRISRRSEKVPWAI